MPWTPNASALKFQQLGREQKFTATPPPQMKLQGMENFLLILMRYAPLWNTTKVMFNNLLSTAQPLENKKRKEENLHSNKVHQALVDYSEQSFTGPSV